MVAGTELCCQGIPPPMSIGNFSFGHFGSPSFNNDLGRGSEPTGERTWTPGSDYRLRKLKMPIFDAEDAYGWVYRIERFFDIQGFVSTGERLRAAVLCLEGQALAWFRWSDGRNPFRH
ncbi:hypothetical protein OSB04_032263 [Centaurea solstitialis]|uniref:Uncharacterized protein n=1 Tax=Centaurea solstitialis TaxID=347529 RepID=A0AA38SNR2_9ASTR|nr:hypothetical protein OSB04_032263 [Centaurea solstitialis]